MASRKSVVSAWCTEWQEMQLTSSSGMLRVDRVHVLRAAGMARQASVIDFLRRMLLENENLGDVSAALDMGGARPVAAFASLVRWTAFRIERCFPVRSLLPVVVEIRVACLANVLRPRIRQGRSLKLPGVFWPEPLGQFYRWQRAFLGFGPVGPPTGNCPEAAVLRRLK